MKLLTVVVSIVAALTANSEHFSDEYSVLQAQQLGESTQADVDGHEMYKPHNDLNKEKRGQNKTNPETNPGTKGNPCEEANGECMKKKTIFEKCNGNIDTNLECDETKSACCISDLRISIINNNYQQQIPDNTGNSLKTIESMLQSRMNELENSIKSVINIVSNGSRIEDLENSVQSVMNIVSNGSRMTDLESSMDSVMNIVSNGSRIDDLENSVQSVINIVSNGSRMNDLESSMDSVMNIVSNETRINDLENSMESMMNIVNHLETSIESVKNIVSNESRINDLETSIESVKNIVSDGSRMDDLEDSIESMVNIMTNVAKRLECPEGFFKTLGSIQCLRLITDFSGTWDAAKEKCRSEGLLLARPNNPVAVNKYLVETYGDTKHHAWIGLRGDGSVFRYLNGPALSNTSPLWWPGQPGSAAPTNHCVILLNASNYIRAHPTKPYHLWPCTHSVTHYPLCELV